jgi:vacuolar-type H+-ATPase subunit D/Vma8
MTVEEKREAIVVECLAALRQIIAETQELGHAKQIAYVAVKTASIIAHEDRIPPVHEQMSMLHKEIKL